VCVLHHIISMQELYDVEDERLVKEDKRRIKEREGKRREERREGSK
jgi:hypothetical protein